MKREQAGPGDLRTGISDAMTGLLTRPRPLSRRRLMGMIGLATGSLLATPLLAACGGDDDDTTPTAASAATATTGGTTGATATTGSNTGATATTGTAPEATATTAAVPAPTEAGEPVVGGHLSIGQSGEPDTLDMHRTESSISWEVGWALFDLLIIADVDLTLHPNLAEGWEVSDDGLSYTFRLRQDVTFHDGEKFNSAAVKFNLDRVVDPATGSLLSIVDIGPYQSTELVDDYTAKVTLASTYGFFLRAMSLMEFPLMSPKIADMAIEDVGLHPIGTGPFKFKEWVTQDHIEVERFEDYNWGPSPPYSHSSSAYLDGITFHFLTDAPTRVAALEAGEVDAIIRTPDTDVQRLQGDGFELVAGLQTGMPSGFFVNTAKFPTDDLVVRRAINLGLDRQQISDGLYAGQEAPGYCPITPTTFAAWDCSSEIYFDPQEAMSSLESAGWTKSGDFYAKDGNPLKIDLYIFGTNAAPGEAFQAAIKEIGVDVNLQVVPFTEQKAVGFEGRHNLMIGRFDAPDPNIMALLFHSKNIGETGFNWLHLNESNPDLQKQIDDLLDAGDQEPDQDKRKDIYVQIQQLIAKNHLFVALKYDALLVMLKPGVHGWRMNDLGFQPRYYDIWIEES